MQVSGRQPEPPRGKDFSVALFSLASQIQGEVKVIKWVNLLLYKRRVPLYMSILSSSM